MTNTLGAVLAATVIAICYMADRSEAEFRNAARYQLQSINVATIAASAQFERKFDPI
jgi:hypothetical protein